MSQVSDESNRQGDSSLRSYNYQTNAGAHSVQVSGSICGAGGDGPGAIFDRSYLVYETAPPRTPTS